MARIHKNNFRTQLASPFSDVATTITLVANIPTLGAGNKIRLTLYDGSTFEIIEIDDLTGAPTYTIAARGLEGTVALNWSTSATIECRLSAGSVDDLEIPAVSLIYTGAPAGVAEVDVTDIGDYAKIQFVLSNFIPVTDNVELRMRTSTNNGSSFDSSASDYRSTYSYHASNTNTGSAATEAATFIQLTIAATGVGNDAGVTGESYCGDVNLYNPANTAVNKHINWTSIYSWSNGTIVRVGGNASRRANTAIDAVRFYFSSGNIASGNIQVYGFKKTL